MAEVQFKGGPKKLLSDLLGTRVTVEGADGTTVVTMGDGLKKLAHKSSEYMPAVRAALKLSDVHGAAECADQLARVRGMCERCSDADGDMDGSFEGTDLGSYTRSLKELVDASPGDTWEEVFDAVEALIQAAIEEQEVRDHSDPDAQMTDTAPTALDAPVGPTHSAGAPPATATPAHGETDMADSKQLTDLETKIADQDKRFADQVSGVTLQLKELGGTVAEQAKTIAAKDEEIKILKDEAAKREELRVAGRIDEAFETYATKYSLNDADKKSMRSALLSDPADFERRYARVAADKRHLMSDLSGPGARRGGSPAEAPVDGEMEISLSEIAIHLAHQKGIELADAQAIVYAQAQKFAAAG